MPPRTLIRVMSNPATASPRTNFEAPSIAPKKVLSELRSSLRFLASSSLIKPDDKNEIISKAESEVKNIEQQFESGLLTKGEKYNKIIDIWSRTNEKVASSMMKALGDKVEVDKNGNEEVTPSFNSVFMLLHVKHQLVQKMLD